MKNGDIYDYINGRDNPRFWGWIRREGLKMRSTLGHTVKPYLIKVLFPTYTNVEKKFSCVT